MPRTINLSTNICAYIYNDTPFVLPMISHHGEIIAREDGRVVCQGSGSRSESLLLALLCRRDSARAERV